MKELSPNQKNVIVRPTYNQGALPWGGAGSVGEPASLEILTSVVREIVRCYELFGFVSAGYPIKPIALRWLKYCEAVEGPDPWVSIVKYKTTALFAFWKKQVIQPCPFTDSDAPGMLLPGRAHRWFKKFATFNSCKGPFMELVDSLKKIKKGLEKPSGEYVNKKKMETVRSLFKKRKQPPVDSWLHADPYAYFDSFSKQSFKRFCCSHPFSSGEPDSVARFLRINKDNANRELERTVDELFRGCRFGIEDIHPTFPSTSANYIATRDSMGSVAILKDHEELFEGLEPIRIRDEWLSNQTFDPEFIWAPDDMRNYIVGEELWRRCWKQSNVHAPIDTSTFDMNYVEFYRRVIEQAVREEPRIVPVGLAEALKARIISKGPAYRQYVLKIFQKWIKKEINKNPVFILTTTPVTEEILTAHLGRPEDGEMILSGDYSDATNKLYSFASEVVGRRIFYHLRQTELGQDELEFGQIEEMFIDSLTRHVYEEIPFHTGDQDELGNEIPVAYGCATHPESKWTCYSGFVPPLGIENHKRKTCKQLGHPLGSCKGPSEHGIIYQQVHGQLMGSVTSFPVLCIINAAICRWAIEISRKRSCRLKECPLLINGDDCLFYVNDVGHQAWRTLGPFFGLEPSVGKYWYSREFAEVNSTLYEFKRDTRYIYDEELSGMCVPRKFITEFCQVKYVNWGLLVGANRSSVSEKKPDTNSKRRVKADPYSLLVLGPNNIGSNTWELKSTCPPRLFNRAYALMRGNFKACLKAAKLAVPIPWYVPTSYGGLGMVPPNGELSKMDRMVCSRIKKRELQFEPVLTKQAWRVHQMVMPEIDKFRGELVEPELSDYDSLYGRLTCNLLFRRDVTSESLYVKDSNAPCVKVMHKHRRVWDSIVKNIKDCKSGKTFDPWQEDIKKLVPMVRIKTVHDLAEQDVVVL